MSWRSKFANAITELGEEVVERVVGVLGADATEGQVKTAAKRLAPVPRPNAPKPKAPAAKATRKPPAAPAKIAARSGHPQAVAKDVLAEAAKPSKGRPSYADWRKANPDGGQLFDLAALDKVPNVPQADLPRYEPPRGAPARMVDALADPKVVQGIDETVQRGVDGGGKGWYNTEPLLDRLRVVDPSGADQAYARMMDLTAATSPRSKVADNVRTASYYNYNLANDVPISEKPAGGYGSVAQNLHRDNVRGIIENGGWDVFQNPKPASFSANLQGNQTPVTVDTHNFRLPGILSRDPRFLATSVKAGTKGSPDVAMSALASRYPSLPESELVRATALMKPAGDLATYRPRDWVEKGYLTPDQAAEDPVLWSTKPQANEYGIYERWQQNRAKEMGISPAQYQASMWLGGGEDTGLGSAAEPFLATVEARVRYTADTLGVDPERLLEMYLKGEVPLLAEGGYVDKDELLKRYS